ncbi:alpha/beta fold hydrolase [Corynebacterium sp. A21]|uniref:alpha/beta fold hydrolase n=1 Tax=Corynebacterium sp. A21 TaxID=3457318 RepID=UPI003FD22458
MTSAQSRATDGGPQSAGPQPSNSGEPVPDANGEFSPSVIALEGPFNHELVHTRGIRLHAVTAGDPENPLIVLVHGSFGGWFDFREVIAPLAAAGYHVAAVDVRGYGMSDKPPTSYGYDLRNAAGDLSGLIRALGHGSAIVIGNDTGGSVAWVLAANHPERVRALVAVAAAHPTDLRRSVSSRPWLFHRLIIRGLLYRLPSGISAHLMRFQKATYRRQLQVNTTTEFQRSPAFREQLELRQLAARISNTGPAIVHNNRLLLSVVPLSWIGRQVTVPTLLMYQEQGAWRHLSNRARLRVAKGSPVEQVAVEGTRNLPQLENPAGFVAAVTDFLAQELPRR